MYSKLIKVKISTDSELFTQYILTQNELDTVYTQIIAQEIPVAVFPFHDEKYPQLHYNIESGLLNGFITVVDSAKQLKNGKLKFSIAKNHRYPMFRPEILIGGGVLNENNRGQSGTSRGTPGTY